jgi:hypothetical protein
VTETLPCDHAGTPVLLDVLWLNPSNVIFSMGCPKHCGLIVDTCHDLSVEAA